MSNDHSGRAYAPASNMSLMVELLRGLAALGVCCSHFAVGTLNQEALWLTGRCSVILFFIISGYVIPLSLARTGYRLSDLGRFLGKRVLRLYPAFLCTIAFMLLLALLKDLLGVVRPPLPTAGQLLGNLLLVPAAFNQAYLVSVFWTLTVEWQYYLMIALAYPILAGGNAWPRRLLLAALLLGPYLPFGSIALLPWTPWFAIGIVLWLRRAHLASAVETGTVIALALASYSLHEGWKPGLLLVLASPLVLLPLHPRLHKFALVAGGISYPLYLFHYPVGAEISVRAWHWMGISTISVWSQPIIIVSVCLAAAWLVNVTIDRTAVAWSSRIRYGRRPAPSLPSGSLVAFASPDPATPAKTPSAS